MARARNLKPGFFKNEDLAECTPWARLCFAGLWTLADREGRLEDRPKRIKGELFAFDNVDVEPLLAELERHHFILRYEAQDGRGLIQVLKFLDHQNPHHREPPSDLPPPQSPGLLHDANIPKPQAEGAFEGMKASGQPEASPGLDPPKNDLATGSSLPVERGGSRAESGTLNPDHGVKTTRAARTPPPDKPDDVDADTWRDWLALRKAKRAPVTPTVIAEARTEAGKAQLSLSRFLAVWCGRGSQGLQADWLKPHERGGTNGTRQPTHREVDEANASAQTSRWTGGILGKAAPAAATMEAIDVTAKRLD